jgi:hypothetical protein
MATSWPQRRLGSDGETLATPESDSDRWTRRHQLSTPPPYTLESSTSQEPPSRPLTTAVQWPQQLSEHPSSEDTGTYCDMDGAKVTPVTVSVTYRRHPRVVHPVPTAVVATARPLQRLVSDGQDQDHAGKVILIDGLCRHQTS